MRRVVRLVNGWLLFGLLVAVLGFATTASAFPWSIDMFRGQAVQPLAIAPRMMPAGTLPTGGQRPMSNEEASNNLTNPLQPTPQNLARGKKLYDSQCAACHGIQGNGDGPAARLFENRYPVANLHSGTPIFADGYIYAFIRNGGLAMPPMADALSAHERWLVVLYIRKLAPKM